MLFYMTQGSHFLTNRTIIHYLHNATLSYLHNVIYRHRCGSEYEYIGETVRKHMRAPSPIIDHHSITCHEVSLDNFRIVGREDKSIARNIKEAILIRANDPSLNRNIGKFQLPHIWDEVLVRSPDLKLK